MQTQWGIVVTAVVMFVVTVIIGQGRYAYAETIDLLGWILIGWYAFKSDIRLIAYLLKWLIFTSVGLILFVYLFIGDNLTPMTLSIKHAAAIGIMIMIIPKAALFYYCSLKLKEEQVGNSNKSSINSENPISKNDFIYETSAYSSTVSNTFVTSSKDSAIVNDEIFYEKAHVEFESNRHNGLWIKTLAKNDGDELKSKFEYIRIRAKDIEVKEAAFNEEQKEQEKYLQLKEKIGNHQKIMIAGCQCFLLDDGKVLYRMQNDDYLIYSNIDRMRVYLEYREKTIGFIGILKKEDNLNSQPKEVNQPTVISVCRKCSTRLRVKNFTGMIKCPECNHSWLFEKKEEKLNPPTSINNEQQSPKINQRKTENIFLSEIKLFFNSFNMVGYIAISLMIILIGVSLFFP